MIRAGVIHVIAALVLCGCHSHAFQTTSPTTTCIRNNAGHMAFSSLSGINHDTPTSCCFQHDHRTHAAVALFAAVPETDTGGGGGLLPPKGPPDDGHGGGMSRRPWGEDGSEDANNNKQQWLQLLTTTMLLSSITTVALKSQVAHASTQSTLDNKVENLSKGTTSLIKKSRSYWSNVFASVGDTLGKVNPFGGGPKQPSAEELEMQQLQKTVVTKVVIRQNGGQTSSLVPQDVLDQCAARAGLIGANLTPGPVQELARLLKQYYQQNGYVLSGMTGATLVTSDKDEESSATSGKGIVEISVEEPVMASIERNGESPVAIAFAKKMVVHPKTGEAMSVRDYKKSLTSMELSSFNLNKLNTTYVQTTGKTRPAVLSNALGFEGGEPFQWSDSDWASIKSSSVFQEILQAEPARLEDGTIQFRIICRERPVRNLEYGVSKSLFNNKWEGEMGLEYGNALGGGEALEVSIRRAAKDAEASYRVSYKDQDFCTPANHKRGWSVEAFNEYIGSGKHHHPSTSDEKSALAAAASAPEALMGAGAKDTDQSFDTDEPTIRKGLSYSVSHPFRSMNIQQSHAQISGEQILSESGRGENIVSSVWSMGPFVTQLPRNGRHSVNVAVGVGSRLGGGGDGSGSDGIAAGDGGSSAGAGGATSAIATTSTAFSPFRWKGGDQEVSSQSSSMLWDKIADNATPYGHVTATTRQIFPFSPSEKNPILLALKHSVSACTSSIPHHRAVANAASVRVRGYGSSQSLNSGDDNDGADSSSPAYQGSILGTTELRVPLQLPSSSKIPLLSLVTQDLSLVLFGEWLFAQRLGSSSSLGEGKNNQLCRQSSVGIGLRKSIQGIPVKYDISLTEEGRVGAFLNFGSDFDVY
jgi:hypothetical protein